jgi:hypothetical protein
MAFDCVRVNFENFDKKQFWHSHSVPFVENYFEVLKHLISDIKTSHFWLIASFVNIEHIDFDFIPEQHETNQIHCFYSGKNKEGNVLLIPKAEFLKQINQIKTLKDFKDINYHNIENDLNTSINTVYYKLEDIVNAYNNIQTKERYVWFVNYDIKNINLPNYFPSFWEEEKAYTFGKTKDIMLLPNKKLIRQLYDLKKIVNIPYGYNIRPSDMIFISYDEPYAVKRYELLKNKYPKLKWVKNIKGQTRAYHTAAKLSDTPYFFAIFPKIDIHDDFDFSFEPDRLKNPCHYIFDCYNTVIDCTYGHDGVILFNKKLVLDTLEHGLDFTLSAAHESIPVLSSYNRLEDSPLIAWRTSFREVIKLCEQNSKKPTVESNFRLKKWTTLGKGRYAEWVYRGALDGVNFYKESSNHLEKSYDFDYIKNLFEEKYNLKYS